MIWIKRRCTYCDAGDDPPLTYCIAEGEQFFACTSCIEKHLAISMAEARRLREGVGDG
jgi:hypothetical protein